MTDSTSRGAGRRRGRFWGPLLGFLLGVALTIAVTTAFLGLGDVPEPGAAEVSPSASALTEDVATEGAAGDVPAPCIEAAQQNQRFAVTMDEAAVAIRDEDAAALAEVLDVLQENRPAMDDASEQCLDLAGVEGGSADEDGAAPEPTETP